MTAVESPPEETTEPATTTRRRPALATVGRWSAAVLVCLAVTAATAFGVSHIGRGRFPGLETASDGRYAFPPLALPTLDAASAAPPSSDSVGPVDGHDGVHDADTRTLLLPAPHGAAVDASFPGVRGWYDVAAYTALYPDAQRERESLDFYGLDHIAATAWRTPDGARTEIYLLRFDNPRLGAEYFSAGTDTPGYDTDHAAAPSSVGTGYADYQVPDGVDASGPNVQGRLGKVRAPGTGLVTRVAYLQDGDTIAVVVMHCPQGLPRAPFDQEVLLQAQLLS